MSGTDLLDKVTWRELVAIPFEGSFSIDRYTPKETSQLLRENTLRRLYLTYSCNNVGKRI